MVQSFPLQRLPVSSDTSIRALSSLTRRDADAVRSTVRAAATGYTVQEHDDYDGYLSLLVTPADDAGVSYVVAGRTGTIDVALLENDDMASLGTFPSIGAAMSVLRPALERRARPTPAPSASVLVARHGPDATLQAALAADARPGHAGWASVLRALDDLGASS
ncbi:MAG: hypothetical protein M3N26_01630 [Pseudomonadota bacterium]|nr:hypothetical protein [Pseudomonadota bacterium]